MSTRNQSVRARSADRSNRHPAVRKATRGVAVESLEDRKLFTVITVNTVGFSAPHDGKISIYEALRAANNNAASGDAPAGQGGNVVDVIRFAIPGTGVHNLGASAYDIGDNVTLDGSSQNTLNNESGMLIQLGGAVNVYGNGAQLNNLVLGKAADGATVTVTGNNNKFINDNIGVGADGTIPVGGNFGGLSDYGDKTTITGSAIASGGEGAALNLYGTNATVDSSVIGSPAQNVAIYIASQAGAGNTQIAADGNLIQNSTINALSGGINVDGAKNTKIYRNTVTIGSPDDNFAAYGVGTFDGATNTLIGGQTKDGVSYGNTISAPAGVAVLNAVGSTDYAGTTILGNHSDPDAGPFTIDLTKDDIGLPDGATPNDSPDADHIVNKPVLTNALYHRTSSGYALDSAGTLDAKPNTSYLIEVSYFSEQAEFQYVTVTTNSAGHATFKTSAPAADSPRDITAVYATATAIVGGKLTDTSENSTKLDFTVDDRPFLSVSSPSVTEGNSGTKSLAFTLTLAAPATKAITVTYNTQIDPGDFANNDDYTPLSGSVTFDIGQTTKTVNVTIKGDAVTEADESFHLYANSLDISGGQSNGKGTILNDDGVTPVTHSITGLLFTEKDADGIYEPGSTEALSVSTSVFLDTNNNNKLDAGEKSTTTDSKGTYTFNGLADGEYHVVRALASGYRLSKFPAGYVLAKLAGANLSGVNLAATNTPLATASIKGMLFYDVNKNGKIDGTGNTADVPQPGKVVFIDSDGDGVLDAGEMQTTSASDGSFSFTGLAAGTYKVRRVLPKGYVYTTPARNLTLTAGQAVTGVLIGTGLA